MAFDFTGKLVLVTGGSAGIGAEISKGIVAGGGHVIVCSRHEDTGRKFVEELGEGNFFYTMDIADAEGVKKTVAQILEECGDVNVLINCAGRISSVPFTEVDDKEWNNTINTNLTGTYNVTHALWQHFIDRGGARIVNVSSVAGKIWRRPPWYCCLRIF